MAGLDPFLVKVNTNTFFRLQVDKTIYDSDIALATGLTQTEPPAGSTIIDVSQRQARRSNKVGRVLVSVSKGRKSRRVPLICDLEKLITIEAALKGKSLNLGITPTAWAVKRVSNG
jgi:hypothetical protein